jgi:hypothetical protein
MKMPLGIWKGVELEQIPEAYLKWSLWGLETLRDPLRAEIRKVLGLRPDPDPVKPYDPADYFRKK